MYIFDSEFVCMYMTTITNIHKKVMYCSFMPNVIFYDNDVYSNPFHDKDLNNHIFTKIPTISDSLKEQSDIEKSLQDIETRKIKREQESELGRMMY